ncbi:MAG: hypothetical protein PHD76_04955 [Methylacidiphilales bacterium]|nr:hypothetical protein [Candidatus Methylacidiphilales bacterium]
MATKKSGYAKQLGAVEDQLRKTPNVSYQSDFKNNPDEPAATVQKAAGILKKTKDDLDATQAKLTESTGQLSESQSQVQKLTTEVTSTKKDLESKTTQLTETTTNLQAAQTELKDFKDQLGGRKLSDILDELKKTTEDSKVLSAEKKIIEDSLAKSTAELKKYQELEQLAKNHAAPMDLSGKVVAINKSWNFVVLDLGKDNKLNEGIDLAVYRGDQLIGKVRTVSVDATTAIADILPDWTKTEIQVGDKVLY